MIDDDDAGGSRRGLGGARWRKSSFSATSECLVFSEVDQDVAVRNSKHPEAGTIHLDRAALASWIADCKTGGFDDLT